MLFSAPVPPFSNAQVTYAQGDRGLGRGQKGLSHSSGNCLDVRRLDRLLAYNSHLRWPQRGRESNCSVHPRRISLRFCALHSSQKMAGPRMLAPRGFISAFV